MYLHDERESGCRTNLPTSCAIFGINAISVVSDVGTLCVNGAIDFAPADRSRGRWHIYFIRGEDIHW